MSYQSIAQLTDNPIFGARIRAAAVEQAEVFKDDARPDFVALAADCLRGDGQVYMTFTRMTAAGPGIADAAGEPPNQAAISDGDILASVQGNWQVVAGLYYDAEGIPLNV